MTILIGSMSLEMCVTCLRLCESCSFTGEIGLKMGKDVRKESQLFGSCMGSPDHSEFALCTNRPRLCMTLGTGTGSFCHFHAGKSLEGAGRGDLLSPVPPQSPVEGRENAQDDRSLCSVTGDQLCSCKGWGKRLGLGKVTRQKMCGL